MKPQSHKNPIQFQLLFQVLIENLSCEECIVKMVINDEFKFAVEANVNNLQLREMPEFFFCNYM